MPALIAQAHLERRGSLYYWHRRWRKPVLDRDLNFLSSRRFLLFPLRTDLLRNAKAVARRLTDLSDLAFAACAEKTMVISPSDMDALLVGLCRFQIEPADLAREIAPMRPLEAAATLSTRIGEASISMAATHAIVPYWRASSRCRCPPIRPLAVAFFSSASARFLQGIWSEMTRMMFFPRLGSK